LSHTHHHLHCSVECSVECSAVQNTPGQSVSAVQNPPGRRPCLGAGGGRGSLLGADEAVDEESVRRLELLPAFEAFVLPDRLLGTVLQVLLGGGGQHTNTGEG
jgi:hypothetical protein